MSEKRTYAVGVDLGSTQSKGIVMDQDYNIIGRSLTNTGVDLVKTGENVYELATANAGIKPDDIAYIVGTGYGRYKVTFGHAQISEITCHARGAKHLFPRTHIVLDIGGQDTKAIKVGSKDEVVNFCMNDKCAAGTGRFLAAAAYVLDIPLDRIGEVSLQSREAVKLSSTCTVFVESEIISHLSKGRKPEDILKGMHMAIANRCVSLIGRVGLEEEITFTGGVARNIGMVRVLEEALETKINVSPDSQYMGAIGASMFAIERALATTAG